MPRTEALSEHWTFGQWFPLTDVGLVFVHPDGHTKFQWGYMEHMPDFVMGLLIGCALGFGIGYAVRERISRKRRRHYLER